MAAWCQARCRVWFLVAAVLGLTRPREVGTFVLFPEVRQNPQWDTHFLPSGQRPYKQTNLPLMAKTAYYHTIEAKKKEIRNIRHIKSISTIVQRVALLKMMQHQQELEQQNCNLNCVHCRITGIFFFVTFTIFLFFSILQKKGKSKGYPLDTIT